MSWAWIALIIFTVICIILFLLSKKYRNPYKLIMIFGKKGSGKSTTLTKLALKYLKKGWTVYTTEPVPGTFKITPEQVGFVSFQPHSVILIDEVGMIWDNRNFKSFKPEVRDFFKLQRHYKLRVYLFSQSFDIDKKLRDLTDEMYLMKCFFNVFSYGKKINRKIVLTKSTSEAPSTISEDLIFDPLLLFWCGSRFLTFIPKYAKYFDSFYTPSLKIVDFPRTPARESNKISFKEKIKRWLRRAK